MIGLRSVRSHVVVGSLLWALGLYAISHLVAIALMDSYPHVIRVAHGTMLTVIALFFIAAGLFGVRSGLKPFDNLRERLTEVRDGRLTRIEGDYPTEVQPLVRDLNALLEDREERVARAISGTGDLAHGLKTPLAVLSQIAESAGTEGHAELANTMSQQIELMRVRIERHLAHARASASGNIPGLSCSLGDSVNALERTLTKLYADRRLSIDLRVDEGDMFRGQRDDLDEMLGNLLDNACKWATSHVVVTSSRDGSRLTIDVDDDGHGLDETQMESVMRRGAREDEVAAGSGLGLAIAKDLAEIYGGALALSHSPEGGLRATLHLPSS